MTIFNETVSDQSAYNETLSTKAVYQPVVPEIVALNDATITQPFIFSDAVTDSAAFNDATSAAGIFRVAEVEAAGFNDVLAGIKRVVVTLTDGTALGDTPLTRALLRFLVTEQLVFTIVLTIGGEEFVCWVSNADTFAHSQYDGFDFNSMCRIGSRYYGAKGDGIYQLDGEGDAGSDIPWFLALPQSDAGTAFFKRVPRVYMGVRNDGAIYIRTLTDGGVQRVYLFRKRAESLAGAGETLGRGVKSRYWGYDLIGVDGSDFELDQIEFFPVVLGRRVS